MLASICPWVVAMPALKSSAVDSIPNMIEGFLGGFFGKSWRLHGFRGVKHVDFYS